MMWALLALTAASAASAPPVEPDRLDYDPPTPEPFDPLADLTPWPDPYAEEPDRFGPYTDDDGSPIGWPSTRLPERTVPSVVTFTAAERIQRAAEKQARKREKRLREGR